MVKLYIKYELTRSVRARLMIAFRRRMWGPFRWFGFGRYQFDPRLVGVRDRNAEHYLWARKEVEQNDFRWGPQYINTSLYTIAKIMSNTTRHLTGIGGPGIIRFWTGYDSPKLHKSPSSFDEFQSGFSGANDGLFGIERNCKCQK